MTLMDMIGTRPGHKAVLLAGCAISLISAATARAETFSFTDASSSTLTYAPQILSGTNTNITSYYSSYAWIYTLNSFTVGTTGLYTISSTTTDVVNTSFVLSGTFTPTSTFPPVTPIENFIASNFAGGFTSTIEDLNLVSGQTYSVLVAYNQTNAGTYPYTVLLTFDGVGCVTVSTNVCSNFTDAQLTEELKLQAAQQGVMLSNMQSRTIIGQLRQRLQTAGFRHAPASSMVHAYASEPDKEGAEAFAALTDKAASHWTAWAETSADGLSGNWNPDVQGYQASQQAGLDYSFGSGWVAGAALGLGFFGNDFDNGGETTGNAYWLAPYVGARLDDWMVTLQGAYTFVDYRKFYTGSSASEATHGHRFSGSLSVARELDLGNAFYAIPEVILSLGGESIADLDGVTSGKVGMSRFFSTRLGGELGYNLSPSSRVYGLAFAEYANINADASATYLSTGYDTVDWSATLGGGLDLNLSERTNVNLEARTQGIGSDTLIYGGKARFSLTF